jgi:uncharacterized membrane-anchored protein
MSDMIAPQSDEAPQQQRLLNKVPEVIIWFWIIKVLCTTVGESLADWINETLGFGLVKTSVLFTVVLAGVLVWQLRLRKYVPFVYWLTVVVVSVTGTLYTDILTDKIKVPLALSTTAFAIALAVVFAVWYSREGTLSIHSIVTLPREAFYWVAVLVTFALGTAAGDWTIELTGWTPGVSVLFPTALLVAVIVGWRLGANPVLAFWLAYILTRPLGANLGDWFASPTSAHGLGLGTAGTSILFLSAILATVIYLTISRKDVTERNKHHEPTAKRDPRREHAMLVYFLVVAVIAGAVLVHAHSQPHAAASSDEESASSPAPAESVTPQKASQSFPAAEVDNFRTIAQDTVAKLQAGDQHGATARIKDLETAWDKDQSALQPRDPATWQVLDGQIDGVLQALRARTPDIATEESRLGTLLQSLG